MRIGSREIGFGKRAFVVAEAGVNHEGSLEKAQQMIQLSAEAGADAIKFQTYKAEKLALRFSPAYWDLAKEPATSQYELFKRYDAFGPDEYRKLAEFARAKRIIFLSTPFDSEAVDFLDDLVPLFKIASADITNTPLLRKVGGTGKPVTLSVGASTVQEIRDAVALLEKTACNAIALLHCVLEYPCPQENANLGRISHLRTLFPQCLIGYSDHTVPDASMTVLTAAAVMGACIIEKHFTLDKSLPGNDHYHAMDADDLRRFTHQLDILEKACQTMTAGYLPAEEPARKHARRSLVAAVDIHAGQVIRETDLIPKRPGHGISPRDFDEVVGRVAKVDIAPETVIEWDMLSK